jgi:hypothetical protein
MPQDRQPQRPTGRVPSLDGKVARPNKGLMATAESEQGTEDVLGSAIAGVALRAHGELDGHARSSQTWRR